MSVQLSKAEAKSFVVELQNTYFPECTDCSISEDTPNRQHVKWRGKVDAPIVIVGEAPGEEEEEQKLAFVGAAGRKLNKLLRSVGIDSDRDTLVTNTVKCRPLKNRNPSAKECRICREKFLAREIKLYPRKLIIALGNFGYYGVVPKGSPSGITSRCGVFEESEEFGCTILSCLHPAGVLHNPATEPLLVDAIRKAAKFIKNGYAHDSQRSVIYKEIHNLDTFWDFISEVKDTSKFVVDLETTGFSAETDEILCMSFSTEPLTAWYLPLYEDENWIWPKSDWEAIEEGLKGIFEDPAIGKMGFNVKFDFKFLVCHFGWDIQGSIDDPMLMHHLIEEGTPHGLKNLAVRYTGMGDYSRPLADAFAKVKRNRELSPEEKHYGKIPTIILKGYAAADADATFRVYEYLLPILKKDPDLFRLYRKGVMPVMSVLMEMELTGIRVDQQRLKEFGKQFRQELKELATEFNECVGEEVNIGSSKQLSELLFQKGVRGKKYRIVKPGKKYPSTDESVLKALQEDTGDRIFDILLQHRKTGKLNSTYVVGMAKQIAPDGRIHTSYLQHGTVTGRLSSSRPNLQNVPRESVVKNIFVPSPGYLLLSADYKQHEVRMWANYSQDPKLIEALSAGEDVHSQIGSMLLSKPAEDISKGERVFVKGVVFGLMYGRGSKSLAEGLGKTLKRKVPEDEAKMFMRLFFNMFPGATQWLYGQQDFAERNGYVRNLFGRVRHLPEVFSLNKKVKAEARRNARNAPIQGLASDVTNLALVRLQKAFKDSDTGARLLLQVHDEVLAEAPIDKIHIVQEIMDEQMSKPVSGISVPLAIDLEVLDCWGGEPVSV